MHILFSSTMPKVFIMFMKGKYNIHLLWPFEEKLISAIVARCSVRDSRVINILYLGKSMENLSSNFLAQLMEDRINLQSWTWVLLSIGLAWPFDGSDVLAHAVGTQTHSAFCPENTCTWLNEEQPVNTTSELTLKEVKQLFLYVPRL